MRREEGGVYGEGGEYVEESGYVEETGYGGRVWNDMR